jgi:hypothetical protein
MLAYECAWNSFEPSRCAECDFCWVSDVMCACALCVVVCSECAVTVRVVCCSPVLFSVCVLFLLFVCCCVAFAFLSLRFFPALGLHSRFHRRRKDSHECRPAQQKTQVTRDRDNGTKGGEERGWVDVWRCMAPSLLPAAIWLRVCSRSASTQPKAASAQKQQRHTQTTGAANTQDNSSPTHTHSLTHSLNSQHTHTRGREQRTGSAAEANCCWQTRQR